jgi:hypothetical protein
MKKDISKIREILEIKYGKLPSPEASDNEKGPSKGPKSK